MIAQLRAELLKIATTRTTAALGLGAVAIVLLLSLLTGLLMPLESIVQEDNQRSVLTSGHAATLFAVLIGVMLVTSEFRHGTIRPTLLYEPRRPLVIVAKAIAGLVAGLVLGVVTELLAIVVGVVVIDARGVERVLGNDDIARFAFGGVVMIALWSTIGVAVGALVRHQVGAIVGLLAYLFVVENLVFALAPSVGRYLPGEAAQAVAGETADRLLATTAGAAVLIAYALVLTAAGAAMTSIRDVD